MFNQKGFSIVAVLVVFVIGFVIYANITGSGTSVLDNLFGSFKIDTKSQAPSVPKSTAPGKVTSTPTPTPIPAGSDTMPPRRLNVDPKDKSSLPADTRYVILSLETDEKATCRYTDTASGIAYGSMQGKFAQVNSALHSALITGLNEGGKYKYYIKCVDEKGNANTDDLAVSFEVKIPQDQTPPVVTNPSHRGDILAADTKTAVMSVSTNEPATCRYSTNAGTSYNSMSGSFSYYDQTKQFHVKQISGLVNGKSYDFFIRCKDMAGNANTGDVLISFSVGY